MSAPSPLHASERLFHLLLRLYPPDFRDEMGEGLVETYLDRSREAADSGVRFRLAGVWVAAIRDSLRNGLGERLRPAPGWRRAGNWGRDLGRVGRRMRRSPLFAATTVATLAVGLGAFAVIYTAVDKILIEPMPYDAPDDLYFVWRDYSAYFDLNRGWLGGPDIAELQTAGGAIEEAAGLAITGTTLSSATGSDPMMISMMLVSPNLFDLLGVTPELGRNFDPGEVGPERPDILMLGHALWQRLGADPAIVGTDVFLADGEPYRVIGVMPEDFHFVRHSSLGPPQATDAYLPFGYDLANQDPDSGSFAGIVRARPGTTPEVVGSAIDAIGRFIDERDHHSRGLRLYSTPLREDLVRRVRPALVALAFAGAFLLLVLTVNLASLLLARAAEREREFAVARALGANASEVVRATLAEGAILGLLGGVAGALAGVWGTRLMVALAPLELPRREAVVLDWNVALVVLATGLMVGVLAGSIPATWASSASLRAPSSVRGGGSSGRIRRSIVVVQVALSLVLLTTGGLVFRSFERLLEADPGFRAEGVLSFASPMGPRLFPETANAQAFLDRVIDGLAALPGVTGASATSVIPLGESFGAQQTRISIPGAPGITGDADRDAPLVDVIRVRAGYVETMGMRVLAGRSFLESRDSEVREVLIDRHLATQFFPTGNPLGAEIPMFGTSVTIVGVVDHARLYDVHRDDRPQIYIRAEDWDARGPLFVLHTDGAPEALISPVRAVVRQIDPRIPVAEMRTMEEVVNDALRQERISAVLTGGFALGALLLVAMGLFGVVAGSVSRRRGELAIRLALGATPRGVVGLVVAEGAWMIALGVLIGAPGIYLSGEAIRGILIGVSPFDATTLVAAGAGLAFVTLVSTFLAASRATQIEPSSLLREEG